MAEDIIVYELEHSSPEIATVGEYCADINSPAAKYVDKENSFLNVKGKDGVTNKERIFNTYTEAENEEYKNKAAKDLLLKVGTVLAVPTEKIERNALLTAGIEVVTNDIVSFKAEALADIEGDAGYVAVNKPISGQINRGSVKEILPDVTVWIWCRSLSSKDGSMSGEIFDVTPFVQSVTTNVGKNGGNFHLKLPPLVCSMNDEGKWVIKRKSLIQYRTNTNLSLAGQGYVAEGSIFTNENSESGSSFSEKLIRNGFLFHNIIGSNDVVFIRYETLAMESATRFKDYENFYVNKNQIADKIYDMIGLVDLNGVNVSPEENDVSINVTGRDLSKLFIDDGTYFYALELSQGKLNFAGGSTQKNDLMQRVFSDNQLTYFNLWYNNSIENVFKFVIQQLSTIKVVPDDLFESYGNRRNTKYNQDKNLGKGSPIDDQLDELEANAKAGIKQLRIENNLTESVSVENKAIQQIFTALRLFLQTLRDKKIRKVTGNSTTGWNAFVWDSPDGINDVFEDTFPRYFDSKLYDLDNYPDGISSPTLSEVMDNVDKYLDTKNQKPKNDESFKKELASGIWQILKLVIDGNVTSRRIVDSSASSANGSLINFFRKVCQEPFVEMYMDTYGDTYNVIIRKPPTDQLGVISYLEGNIMHERGVVKSTPAIIDVEADDVLGEDLNFNDSEVVSWYHLTPRQAFLGDSQNFSLSYLPAIFLQEYADIWGSKPMQLVHNYMPYVPLDPKSDTQLSITEKQAIYDIKYMVESNQHIPFTRSGSIRLNGDRRLKMGNFMRYKPTGEIFHIDAVQQGFNISESSIDRTTVVQVSRGMVEQFIYGIPDGDKEHISYFNIVNTKLNFKSKEVDVPAEEVEPEVFEEEEKNNEDTLKLGKVLAKETLRNDSQGQSGFGVSRIGHTHQGVDIVTIAGEPVYAPIDGVLRLAKPYKNKDVGGMGIIGTGAYKGYEVKMFYSIAKVPFGSKVKKGDMIGVSYDLTKLYPKITPHIHFELVKKGVKLDPTEYVFNDKELERLFGDEAEDPTPVAPTAAPAAPKKTQSFDRDAVFSNFKVNVNVFNFFLRKEQFKKEHNAGNIVRRIYNKDVAEKMGRV